MKPKAARPAALAGLLFLFFAGTCLPPPLAVAAAPAASPPVAGDFRFQGFFVQGGLVLGQAPAGTTILLLDGARLPLARDGRFLLGFDRDHGARAALEARLADGRSVRRALAVAPRAWAIEHVGIARRPGLPDAAFQRLRAGELARIAAARGRAVEAGGWRQAFIRPARGRVSGLFGAQRVYRGVPASFHNGVDLAAGAGAAVVAPADGIVVLAGPPAFSLEGNLVILAHGMGLTSAFLHLSATSVTVGQTVRQGDPIGRVGATGRATGPHLHWGMRWRDARIDPQRLVAARSGFSAPAAP